MNDIPSQIVADNGIECPVSLQIQGTGRRFTAVAGNAILIQKRLDHLRELMVERRRGKHRNCGKTKEGESGTDAHQGAAPSYRIHNDENDYCERSPSMLATFSARTAEEYGFCRNPASPLPVKRRMVSTSLYPLERITLISGLIRRI